MICTQCPDRQLRRDTDLHGQSGDITCSLERTKNSVLRRRAWGTWALERAITLAGERRGTNHRNRDSALGKVAYHAGQLGWWTALKTGFAAY